MRRARLAAAIIALGIAFVLQTTSDCEAQPRKESASGTKTKTGFEALEGRWVRPDGAIQAAPRFRTKRAIRFALDRLQFDWPFDLLLYSPPLRWAAERVYFYKRGA